MAKVTEEKFLQIKSFLGEPYNTDFNVLAKLFNLSRSTIYNISQVEDYKGYKTLVLNSLTHLKEKRLLEKFNKEGITDVKIEEKVSGEVERPAWIPYFSYTFVFRWGSSFKQDKLFITVNEKTLRSAEAKAGRIFNQSFPQNGAATQELNSIKDPSRA